MQEQVTAEPPKARTRAGTYYPALDGLRAVAVLVVMVAHGSVRMLDTESRYGGGGLGVQIFFVLSGFLITTLLLAEHQQHGKISLKDFYIRRALRIWPLYYAVLGLYALLLPAIDSTYFSGVYVSADQAGYDQYRTSLWPFALFLQNYLVDIEHVRVGLGIFWSLAVEEQFYIFWPLTLIALTRLRWRFAIPAFLTATLAVSLIVRALTIHDVLPSPTNVEWMTHTGLAGLACGALLAWQRWSSGSDLLLPRTHGAFGNTLAWTVLGVVALSKWPGAADLGAGVRLPYLEYYEPLLIGIAVAAIIDRLVTVDPSGVILRSRPLVYLGRVSYGMYLLHPLVLGGIAYLLASTPQHPAGWPGMLVFIAATTALAGMSFRYFERPILRRKRRFQHVGMPTTAPLRTRCSADGCSAAPHSTPRRG